MLTAEIASAAGPGLLVPAQQQDQIIKGLEAARAKLKEKITTYKKEQVRVTNELHEQHVLIATLKSQNEGLKVQLELLKSERANWREYESLKGTSTTPFKHKQCRQAMTPVAHQDYNDAVVLSSIVAIFTLTRNRVILTTEEAVQARTDCLELICLSMRGCAMNGPKAMLNAVRSIKDKIKGAKQASKEMSSASEDEAESSSSESIDELWGKKVMECNRYEDQKEHKERTMTCKRMRKESNENGVWHQP
eukprot:m51a1_g12974 hypothetical protein (249) ;mRNA; f:810-3050